MVWQFMPRWHTQVNLYGTYSKNMQTKKQDSETRYLVKRDSFILPLKRAAVIFYLTAYYYKQ